MVDFVKRKFLPPQDVAAQPAVPTHRKAKHKDVLNALLGELLDRTQHAASLHFIDSSNTDYFHYICRKPQQQLLL